MSQHARHACACVCMRLQVCAWAHKRCVPLCGQVVWAPVFQDFQTNARICMSLYACVRPHALQLHLDVSTPRKARHAVEEFGPESVKAPESTIFALDIRTMNAGYFRYTADGNDPRFKAVQETGLQAWPPGMLEWGTWPNPWTNRSLS